MPYLSLEITFAYASITYPQLATSVKSVKNVKVGSHTSSNGLPFPIVNVHQSPVPAGPCVCLIMVSVSIAHEKV